MHTHTQHTHHTHTHTHTHTHVQTHTYMHTHHTHTNHCVLHKKGKEGGGVEGTRYTKHEQLLTIPNYSSCSYNDILFRLENSNELCTYVIYRWFDSDWLTLSYSLVHSLGELEGGRDSRHNTMQIIINQLRPNLTTTCVS